MADENLKQRLHDYLKQEFPEDTVDVSDGYHENVHVVVVSRKFDKFQSEKEKQEYLWDLLTKSGISDDQQNKISLIVPLSPAELK